ncbi:hypothetical protein [Marinagarivorans algicola]|nr:hypothetical protein [Marinagarivorans algicola]
MDDLRAYFFDWGDIAAEVWIFLCSGSAALNSLLPTPAQKAGCAGW